MSISMILNRSADSYNFRPKASIPELSGKVIVVTGGNTGLGLHSIIHLVEHNPSRVYLTARSKAKYDDAVAEIIQHVPTAVNSLRFVEMDLSSLASSKRAAESILRDTDRIHILMNNAGIMGAPAGLTAEGYEIHFGTNHMGHALFTKILMPILLKTVEQTPVRIVNVASGAYQMCDSKSGFDEKMVKTDMASFTGSSGNLMSRYGQSKLANILHAKALAKRYPSVTSVAINPGRVKTTLLDGIYKDGRDKLYGYFQMAYDLVIGAHSVDVGAYTQVWAATEPKKERIESGAVYNPVGSKDNGTKFSNDESLADRLWNFTEAELKELGY